MAGWSGGFFLNLFANRQRAPPPPPPPPPAGLGGPGPGAPPGVRPVPARVQDLLQLQNVRLTRAQFRELAQIEARKIEQYFNRHRDQFEYLFRGAQHVLQLFYIPGSIDDPLIGAPGLTIFTEWIESGTLRNFMDRCMNRTLPNRMLLEFFKCLVHFCIAMAWPPKGNKRAPYQEEKIPADFQKRTKKEQITHVMIGSLDPEGGGHGLVPILKLIDFDQAGNPARPSGVNPGVTMNIRDIGQVMRTIITGDLTMSSMPGEVTVTVGGSRRTFFTQGADLTTTRYKNLDPRLAALVQWCLASPIFRPSLELLDYSLTELMRIATPDRYAGYRGGKYESDNEIGRVVQRFILDAD
ncbi:hypothetical protein F4782DRAFT_531658 [Xylaria castorea]|nr:hypothetical protein F4782DRAFT_531658 [Xylaria castorea]